MLSSPLPGPGDSQEDRMFRSAFRPVAARIFINLAIVSIAACSPPPEDAPPAGQATVETEGRYSSSLSVITRQNLQEHLDYLADDARAGRMTGTEDYDEAAAYVAQQFEALGLTPGGDEGWYQNVPMLGRRLDIESAAVTLHRDSGDSELEW